MLLQPDFSVLIYRLVDLPLQYALTSKFEGTNSLKISEENFIMTTHTTFSSR